MLNEVFPHPASAITSPPQSLDKGDEWVELFNASCEDVDVGGWYIATQALANDGLPGGGGVIRLDPGTVVPALGTLAIGRLHTTGTIECRIPEFVMDNEQGWIGLYNDQEAPVDAVFWSPSSSNIAGPRYSLSPCASTGLIFLPSAQVFQSMGKMTYVGADPSPGQVYRRFPDGSNWQTIQGGATPNECNIGTCEAPPSSKIIASKLELCSGEVLVLNADLPNPLWTYTWTNGTPSSGTSTDVLFSNTTKVEINRMVKLAVKSASGLCEKRDSIELTILPIKSITKINGDNTACALNFSDYNADLSDADSYTWNIEGGKVSSGQGTADVTVSWGNTTNMGRVCVSAMGQCVSTSPVCKSVNLLPQRDLDSIIGEKQVCTNSINNYSIPAFFEANAYNWTATNGTFIGPKNTAIAKVKWLQGGGRLCATIQSACSNPVPYCIDITTSDSIKTTPIIGDSSVCFNEIKNFSTLMPTTVLMTKWSYLDSVFSFIGRKENIELTLIKSGNIELQIFGECIDTSVQRLNVKVFSKPTVNYALDGQPCVGDTLTYNFVGSEDFNLSFYAIKGRILETSNRILKVVYYNETSDVIKILHSRNGTQSLPCDKDTLFIPVTIKQCNICDDSTKAKFSYPDTVFCFESQPIFPSAFDNSALGKLTSPTLQNFIDTSSRSLSLFNAPSGYHKIFNTYFPSNPLCPIVRDSIIIRNVNEKFKVAYNSSSCDGKTPIELTGAESYFIGLATTVPSFILNYSNDTTLRFRGVISKCSTTLDINLKKDIPLEKIGPINISLCNDTLQGTPFVQLDTVFNKYKIFGSVIDLKTNTVFEKNIVHIDSIFDDILELGVIRSTNNTCPSDTVVLIFSKQKCNPCVDALQNAKFAYDSVYCNNKSIVKPIIFPGSTAGSFTSGDIVNLPTDGSIDLSKLVSGNYKIFNTLSSSLMQCEKTIDSFILKIVNFNITIDYDSIACKGEEIRIKLNGGNSYKIENTEVQPIFQVKINQDTSLSISSFKSGCEVTEIISIKAENCEQDTCKSQDKITDLRILEFGKCVNDTVVIKAFGNLAKGGSFSLLGSPSFNVLEQDSVFISFIASDSGLYKVEYKTNDLDGAGPCLSVSDTVAFNIFATPAKPRVLDFSICNNTHVLRKQNQIITWINLSTGSLFTNDTLRNLPIGLNRYAASTNINGCTSDTSQFIVKVNATPARLFPQDTFLLERCFDVRDSLQFNIDTSVFNLVFQTNVLKGNNQFYYFQNNGKLKWKIVDKTTSCERSDSLIFKKKPLNPINLDIINPRCSGDRNGIITLKGLVQPFNENRLFLNKIEIPFQQSIDSLTEGKYSLLINHPDFCDVEKMVELQNSNPLKSIIQTSSSGELELGSNLVAVLQILGGTEPYTIKWQSINSLNCDTCTQVLLSVRKEELLQVLIKDAQGCDTAITFQLEIKGNGILFPNIINSSSSDENAIFNPMKYLGEEILITQLSIYNRWGNTIFTARNLPKDWPGINFNTIDLAQDVYLFYLEITENGKVDKIFGDFLYLK